MNIISRIVIVGAIAPASLGATGASADARTAATCFAAGDAQQRCWEAECGGGEKPFKLILPLCYAHELSYLVPQCGDD